MRVVIFGLGSIGRRHFSLLRKYYDFDISFHRHRSYENYLSCIKGDIAFICNPTHKHLETAIECAKRSMAIFLEKPIDVSADRLDELLEIVDKKSLTCYVAYPFRHHPLIQQLKKTYFRDEGRFTCTTDFTKWHSYKNYSYHRDQGGDVLLELSHEIDMAAYLFGRIASIDGHTFMSHSAPTDGLTAAWLKIQHTSGNLSWHNLDTFWPYERREFEIGRTHYKLEVSDEMYTDQLHYFMYNLDNPQLTNNIFEAAETFRQIIEFRAEQYKGRV